MASLDMTFERPSVASNHKLWLDDYIIAVNCQGGTTTIAMQYVQLMLVGSARTWLQNLPPNSFSSWDQFEDAFVKNFLGT